MRVADGIAFSDTSLVPIWEKVLSGARLSLEDGVRLFETDDFPAVGRMADHVKRQRDADRVYFVLNRHLNPTNICVLSCTFCDFAKKKGDPDAYEMSMEEILGHLDEDTREVHMVGGHHPDWPFEKYVEIVSTIHRNFPNVQVKAFTAAEIDYFYRRWKVDPEESLAVLKEAGLRSMPGGGAEVFSDRVHKLLLPGKNTANRWLEIHSMAHRMGIPSNATLLYGHIETYRERVEHMIRLRELQDDTGGFLAFIPLEYQTGDTNLVPRQGVGHRRSENRGRGQAHPGQFPPRQGLLGDDRRGDGIHLPALWSQRPGRHHRQGEDRSRCQGGQPRRSGQGTDGKPDPRRGEGARGTGRTLQHGPRL